MATIKHRMTLETAKCPVSTFSRRIPQEINMNDRAAKTTLQIVFLGRR